MARVLFHIDINAFFASAEILKKPSLAGRPIAIGSVSRHGVLSTMGFIVPCQFMRPYGFVRT